MSDDQGTEADYLSDWDDEEYEVETDEPRTRSAAPRVSSYARPLPRLEKRELGKVKNEQQNNAKKNAGRWRCLTTGCNPALNEATASEHNTTTGHRVAAWPVRSVEGTRRAKARNRTGYYDRYNVGYKSARNRGIY